MTPRSPHTCRLVTLGCKVNQYETQELRDALGADGYHDAAPGEPADLCVVNTCTVTARTDQKARQLIRRLVRENPGARVLVIGCYAVRDPERLRAIPGVTEVVADRGELVSALGRLGAHTAPSGIRTFHGHHRAWVKVQDGCRFRCTYCIIPYVRPAERSRPMGDVVEEVRRLLATGFREIVLTGVHLGHYGRGLDQGDGPPPQLWRLLDRLGRLRGEFRIRLSSLEATELSPSLIDVVAGNPRICPHFHVALQSGSDRVLKRMARPYTTRAFLRYVERARKRLDEPALTTDLIVGFPGETESDFQATCRVVRQVGFSRLHVFPFSARPGTPAATWQDQVSGRVIRDRGTALAELGRALADRFLRRLVGKRLQVLVERGTGPTRADLYGTADRYVHVHLQGPTALIGQLVSVEGRGVDGQVLEAGAHGTRPVNAQTPARGYGYE